RGRLVQSRAGGPPFQDRPWGAPGRCSLLMRASAPLTWRARQQKHAKLVVSADHAGRQRRPVKRLTETDLRKRLAANVKALRAASNLTLEEAGFRAELNWRHWQKIEAGETSVTLRTLARLANALAIDPCDLLAPPRRDGSG